MHCPETAGGCWDADRLEQVFSNLVSNAIHYGDPERPVTIDVQEDGQAVIAGVHNYGAQIPEALRTELFNPFKRGKSDSKTSETGGLGLGLYISRELVRAHGGDIDVQSTATGGTTFRVSLPRMPRDSPSS